MLGKRLNQKPESVVASMAEAIKQSQLFWLVTLGNTGSAKVSLIYRMLVDRWFPKYYKYTQDVYWFVEVAGKPLWNSKSTLDEIEEGPTPIVILICRTRFHILQHHYGCFNSRGPPQKRWLFLWLACKTTKRPQPTLMMLKPKLCKRTASLVAPSPLSNKAYWKSNSPQRSLCPTRSDVVWAQHRAVGNAHFCDTTLKCFPKTNLYIRNTFFVSQKWGINPLIPQPRPNKNPWVSVHHSVQGPRFTLDSGASIQHGAHICPRHHLSSESNPWRGVPGLSVPFNPRSQQAKPMAASLRFHPNVK